MTLGFHGSHKGRKEKSKKCYTTSNLARIILTRIVDIEDAIRGEWKSSALKAPVVAQRLKKYSTPGGGGMPSTPLCNSSNVKDFVFRIS